MKLEFNDLLFIPIYIDDTWGEIMSQDSKPKSWNITETDKILRVDFDAPGTEVNVLSFDNLSELNQVLDGLSGRSDMKAILFTSSKKRIFIAGADINEIRNISTQADAIDKAEQGKAIFQKIEDLKCPTISVINGACLGGGYELSLACDWRVAADSPAVKIGLPEVNLGILPGFGGSIRLPLLLGLQKALPLILAGRVVSAKQALKNGMVDQVYAPETLIEDAMKLALKAVKRPKGIGLPGHFERLVLAPLAIYPAARKNVLKKTKGQYPAPLKTLDLIEKSYGINRAKAFRMESEFFSELAVTDISKNLIRLFFMNERYKKLPWTKLQSTQPPVKKCGIIGAGVMGGGIAQLVSYRDIPTAIKDISQPALEGALREAGRIYQGAVDRGKLKPEAMHTKMELINIEATDEDLAASDLIIEAVVEDLGIKQKVFKEWSAKISPETVLASNTSSLPVTKMAEVATHPERVIGLHFFNPVHRMPLVEIINTEFTSEETLERTVQFARTLGKTVIVTKDAPGFLVNRLLLPYMNEAAFLIQEGVPPETIDYAARKFGMPMGPIELVDQVGIDVGYKVAHILQNAFGERMMVATILNTAYEKKLLGKKSGRGFYIYEGKTVTTNPELNLPSGKSPLEVDMIIKRLIYVMINEAARCLAEKVIDEPATVDMGMVMGTGSPPFRAGLLHYADALGTASILKDLEALHHDRNAIRFEPCAYLKSLGEANKPFYS